MKCSFSKFFVILPKAASFNICNNNGYNAWSPKALSINLTVPALLTTPSTEFVTASIIVSILTRAQPASTMALNIPMTSSSDGPFPLPYQGEVFLLTRDRIKLSFKHDTHSVKPVSGRLFMTNFRYVHKTLLLLPFRVLQLANLQLQTFNYHLTNPSECHFPPAPFFPIFSGWCFEFLLRRYPNPAAKALKCPFVDSGTSD